jgi:transmembrane 9 superfamily protein 2/4
MRRAYLQLEIVAFIPTLLYFTYSGLMSLAMFLFTATVGFFASYWFVCRIYGAVKID